jgi:3-dehydrosphinganine reductase
MNVHIFYPGNIDSPGYIEENRNKPVECREIEGAADLISPAIVAQSLVDGIRQGQYAITNDIGIWLTRVVGNGVVPRKNSLLEMALLPIMVVIQIGFVFYMDFVVQKSLRTKTGKEKAN